MSIPPLTSHLVPVFMMWGFHTIPARYLIFVPSAMLYKLLSKYIVDVETYPYGCGVKQALNPCAINYQIDFVV